MIIVFLSDISLSTMPSKFSLVNISFKCTIFHLKLHFYSQYSFHIFFSLWNPGKIDCILMNSTLIFTCNHLFSNIISTPTQLRDMTEAETSAC